MTLMAYRERVCTRDQYDSVTFPSARQLAPTTTICIAKIYVGVFQYTYHSISPLFSFNLPSSVSTSHQNVVLEIDFAGALWVRFPPVPDLFPTQTFPRATRIYLLSQVTSSSEPFTSIAVSAVRRIMRPQLFPPDASP
jgi:hypothetical protein